MNKKALYDYEILESFEAGLVLTGSEVKSLRAGNASLKGAFVTLRQEGKNPALYLLNAHISPYKMASGVAQSDPTRSRKLLLHAHEISSLLGKIQPKGLTLIPIKVYTRGSRIKLEFGLAKGKKKFDKRESIKKRESERQMRRMFKTRG